MTISEFAGRAGLLAATLALLLAVPAAAQDKDPLIAKVNGIEIHQSDLAVAEEEAGQIPPMSPDAKKDYLVQFMTDMILVSKAAEAKKMDATPEFKRKVAFARNKLLMEDLLQSVGKEALTDEAMHKVYDEAVKQMGEEQEVHARHILIRAAPGDDKASKAAEDKIKAIIVRLKKGEDFAKVAAEITEDPSGKANGGDLGYFSKEQMVPEFSEVAFKLEKGQISEPVKTQFGWHVHQGRGQARKALAEVRRGQGADRELRGAQGAGRACAEAARRRQDRENVQDRGARRSARAGGTGGAGEEVAAIAAIKNYRHGRACPGHFA